MQLFVRVCSDFQRENINVLSRLIRLSFSIVFVVVGGARFSRPSHCKLQFNYISVHLKIFRRSVCSHTSAPYVICNFAMLNKWFFAAILCLRWHLVLLLCTVVKCVTLCVCWVHCRKITTICSMNITLFDVKIFSHCTNGTLKVTKSTFNLETRECTFNSFRVSLAHKTVPMIYNRINIECVKYTGSCSRTMYSAT